MKLIITVFGMLLGIFILCVYLSTHEVGALQPITEQLGKQSLQTNSIKTVMAVKHQPEACFWRYDVRFE